MTDKLKLSDGFSAAAQVRDALDAEGFVSLDDALPEPMLVKAREYVKELIVGHGHRYFSVINPSEESKAIRDIVSDERLRAAIKFVVGQQMILRSLFGTRNIQHAIENVRAAHSHLSTDEWNQLAQVQKA